MPQSFLPVLNEVEKASLDERQPLPARFRGLDDAEMDRRITAAKAALGSRLVDPRPSLPARRGDQVRRLIGDSLKSRQHMRQPARGRLHRLLRRALHGGERRRPERAAPEGHPARPGRRLLDGRHGRRRSTSRSAGRSSTRWASTRVVPVTYINSSAAIKAFVGEHGGVVSHLGQRARGARSGRWQRGRRVLFLPDQHLGRNTAFKMGVPLDQMVVWDPHRDRRRPDARAGARRAAAAVEGPLLRARALHRAADRAGSRESIQASASSSTPRCRSTWSRPPTTAAPPNTS